MSDMQEHQSTVIKIPSLLATNAITRYYHSHPAGGSGVADDHAGDRERR